MDAQRQPSLRLARRHLVSLPQAAWAHKPLWKGGVAIDVAHQNRAGRSVPALFQTAQLPQVGAGHSTLSVPAHGSNFAGNVAA